MIVHTPRMRLRPVTADDVERLVHLDSDPEVMRFVSGGAATSREVIEDWVLPRAQRQFQQGLGGLWSATDRSHGGFVGWFSLRHPHHSTRPEVELSYRLRRPHWGRGLATEGGLAIVSLAFAELGSERLFATTNAANIGSRRVMEKLGMRLTSVESTPNRQIDDDLHLDPDDPDMAEIEYEMLRSQWVRRRRAAAGSNPRLEIFRRSARRRPSARGIEPGTHAGAWYDNTAYTNAAHESASYDMLGNETGKSVRGRHHRPRTRWQDPDATGTG